MKTEKGYEHNLNRRVFESWGLCYYDLLDEVRNIVPMAPPPQAPPRPARDYLMRTYNN